MTGLFNVIRAELFKARRKRRIYVFAALAWILPAVILLLIAYIAHTRINIDDGGATQEIIKFLAAPITIARINLILMINFVFFLIIVIALLSTLFIGEERNQKMWKTVLVAEPNRFTVLLGKIITAMLLLFFLFLGCLLSGVVFGYLGTLFLPTEFSGDWLPVVKIYATQWLFTLTMLLFGFLMVWWLRNNALAIVGIILLPRLVEGLYGIYAVISEVGQVNNRFMAALEALQLRNTLENLPRYFLTSNFSAPSREIILSVEEFSELDFFNEIGGAGPFVNMFTIDLNRSMIVMGIYALIFGILLFWSFRRRDVA